VQLNDTLYRAIGFNPLMHHRQNIKVRPKLTWRIIARIDVTLQETKKHNICFPFSDTSWYKYHFIFVIYWMPRKI